MRTLTNSLLALISIATLTSCASYKHDKQGFNLTHTHVGEFHSDTIILRMSMFLDADYKGEICFSKKNHCYWDSVEWTIQDEFVYIWKLQHSANERPWIVGSYCNMGVYFLVDDSCSFFTFRERRYYKGRTWFWGYCTEMIRSGISKNIIDKSFDSEEAVVAKLRMEYQREDLFSTPRKPFRKNRLARRLHREDRKFRHKYFGWPIRKDVPMVL